MRDCQYSVGRKGLEIPFLLHTGVVVAGDGGGRIIQRCEQILLDVPNTRGTAVQALKDVPDMGTVDLAQALLHKPCGMRFSRNSKRGLGGTKRLGHDLNNFIQTL